MCEYMREIYLGKLCKSSAGHMNLCHINFYHAIRYNAYSLEYINKNRINLSRGPF